MEAKEKFELPEKVWINYNRVKNTIRDYYFNPNGLSNLGKKQQQLMSDMLLDIEYAVGPLKKILDELETYFEDPNKKDSEFANNALEQLKKYSEQLDQINQELIEIRERHQSRTVDEKQPDEKKYEGSKKWKTARNEAFHTLIFDVYTGVKKLYIEMCKREGKEIAPEFAQTLEAVTKRVEIAPYASSFRSREENQKLQDEAHARKPWMWYDVIETMVTVLGKVYGPEKITQFRDEIKTELKPMLENQRETKRRLKNGPVSQTNPNETGSEKLQKEIKSIIERIFNKYINTFRMALTTYRGELKALYQSDLPESMKTSLKEEYTNDFLKVLGRSELPEQEELDAMLSEKNEESKSGKSSTKK